MMRPYVYSGDDRLDLEGGQYSRFGAHNHRIAETGNDDRPYQSWNQDRSRESWSRGNNRSRPSTAPANLYGDDSYYSPSSARDRHPPSWSLDMNDDCRSWTAHSKHQAEAHDVSLSRKFIRGCALDDPSKWDRGRAHFPDSYRKQRRCLDRIPERKPRHSSPGIFQSGSRSSERCLDQIPEHKLRHSSPGSSQSGSRSSGSRSPRRTHVFQGRRGPAREDWGIKSRRDLANPRYPDKYRRSSSNSEYYGTDQAFPPSGPDASTHLPWLCTAGEDPFFKPRRGDIVIVQLDQRGRFPDRSRPRQHYGCVRSFSGSEADFAFTNGDLIVRIGSFSSTPVGGSSYLPYRILELYRKHDGMWQFLGDARTEEDLCERRRTSCSEEDPSGGGKVRVGLNSRIEPNYGDVIIHKDRINCATADELRSSADSVIEWWTPQLLGGFNMVYRDDTILLRPYVLDAELHQTRESWLGRRVTRANIDRKGNLDEGTVVKVWPESRLRNIGNPFASRDWERLEVLGPERVGVRFGKAASRSDVREEVIAWPLSDTYLECSGRPMSAELPSLQKRRTWMDDPWGSVLMYIYTKEPPAGWVYWGGSPHTYHTPSRPSSGRPI